MKSARERAADWNDFSHMWDIKKPPRGITNGPSLPLGWGWGLCQGREHQDNGGGAQCLPQGRLGVEGKLGTLWKVVGTEIEGIGVGTKYT